MTTKRIFLGTKRDLSMGAICDVTTKTALSYKFNHRTTQRGLAGAREVALASAVDILKSTEVKDLSVPIQIFTISSLSDMITHQTYKYWLISGKKNDGTDVHAEELKLWKEFEKIMAKKNSYIIFKNLNDANFNGVPKFNQEEVAYNKFYYEWTWKQIHAVYPQGPQAPSIPENPAV